MDKVLSPAQSLHGIITVPGDKSISHRSVLIGALSEGTSEIEGFLDAADPLSTLSCINALGIKHAFVNKTLLLYGRGLFGLQPSSSVLDAGNSGTTIRLLSGILSGQPFASSISGDQYLTRRPMKRIIDPLEKMGAHITSSPECTAPLHIQGRYPLTPIDYELPVASAQVKSAVLLAGLYAEGETRVIESKPSRDHTERMLHLSKKLENGKTITSVTSGKKFRGDKYLVPGDPSSAAFFIVAGLIVPHSEILIRNVGLNPTRTGFIDVLLAMNADIIIENKRTIGGEPVGDIIVRTSELRNGRTLEGDIIPNIIDEIPILSIAGMFAQGLFCIRGAKDLRNKESDRIHSMCTNIRLTGIDVEEFDDGFAFESKNNLFQAEFDSFDDHRIAMAFGIASLVLKGETKIKNAECVSISFPAFWELLQSLQQ